MGNITLGGDAPIRIQTMCNTDTNNTNGSVQQALDVAKAGAELIRFTAQGIKEAGNLKNIKSELQKSGCKVPLVADIHFNPKAALEAALHVEKVRINPGNFVDPAKRFAQVELTEEEYVSELANIRHKFIPFLALCKKNNTAIRIGVNHGSLSDRIMSRYGDTPEGMVESCMEYLRIAKEFGFENIVLSIKASNTRVMVHTVRLLVTTMDDEGMNFPLHLGVTEAGDAEEGRIKSAVGIGALLLDGIGDTIRVSLSEDPVAELPVAKMMVDYTTLQQNHEEVQSFNLNFYNDLKYERVNSVEVGSIGGNQLPVVVSAEPSAGDLQADYTVKHSSLVSDRETIEFVQVDDNTLIESLEDYSGKVLILSTENVNIHAALRSMRLRLLEHNIDQPVIARIRYNENSKEEFMVKSAMDAGILFLDGLFDGIWLENEAIDNNKVVETAFSILQASRVRMVKTDYISCPGCGRTLFNLQETIARIKAQTSHLTGLKIGIMGCIVNGPGEMADADYGYVGAGRGKINLYKGQQCIEKNIPETEAVERLIKLIKDNGDWEES